MWLRAQRVGPRAIHPANPRAHMERDDEGGRVPDGADLLNVMSRDASRPSKRSEEVLANATTQQDGLFRVRAVLE